MESRVAALEKQVAELLQSRKNATGKWWIDHAGTFANDPTFDLIVKEGRKYRESLRPKSKKRKTRKTKGRADT